MTLATLDLIRLGRDRHVYEWEAIESIALGGGLATKGGACVG